MPGHLPEGVGLAPDEVGARLVGDEALARRAPRTVLDAGAAGLVDPGRPVALPSGAPLGERRQRAAQPSARLRQCVAHARWTPAHDEVDGVTRVLVRRAYTGLDGRPVVLEERVLETFPARDAAWEARFTEAMSTARFRCAYLNAEEAP